jgi:uncharacterized protein
VRAVLDVNVLISALLSREGAPARIVTAWLDGAFELVVSPLLIGELRTALAYPKLRRRISPETAEEYVAILTRTAIQTPDAPGPPGLRSADPDDDYLIALASSAGAMLVTGDAHLIELADRAPIHAPVEFLELLADR